MKTIVIDFKNLNIQTRSSNRSEETKNQLLTEKNHKSDSQLKDIKRNFLLNHQIISKEEKLEIKETNQIHLTQKNFHPAKTIDFYNTDISQKFRSKYNDMLENIISKPKKTGCNLLKGEGRYLKKETLDRLKFKKDQILKILYPDPGQKKVNVFKPENKKNLIFKDKIYTPVDKKKNHINNMFNLNVKNYNNSFLIEENEDEVQETNYLSRKSPNNNKKAMFNLINKILLK